VTEASVNAWGERKPGRFSWGLENAVLGHNRRMVKRDGSARMYGVGDPAGNIAIATNPFELFVDYGMMIKAHSKAILTFFVQLSCQHSGYFPAERAARGGGYSAEKYLVGPDGE